MYNIYIYIYIYMYIYNIQQSRHTIVQTDFSTVKCNFNIRRNKQY